MSLALPLLAVIGGLIVLVWSADRFVFGASALARNLGVTPLLIGLTVVAFGTSAPEVLVSILASVQGNPGLAVGNALGSNIANIALVLGATALILPLTISHGLVWRELPILLGASVVVLLLLLDGVLGRIEGIFLLAGLAAFTTWVILAGRRAQQTAGGTPPEFAQAQAAAVPEATPIRPALAWLGAGLLLLLGSSQALVWGAVEIAEALGVSDLVIGLSIVAIGTSLPELATSVAAALRREAGLAIGNVIGSNLFNLLAVLAIPGLLAPLTVEPAVLTRDYPMMLGLTALLFLLALSSGRRIRRWHGALLLALFAGYLVYLAFTATP